MIETNVSFHTIRGARLAAVLLLPDQAALDVHAKVNLTRAPMPPGLRAEGGSREDYQYNLTR